ncbi:NADP-dependent oxidoreductase domain-containing protein [Trametes elegans]|nr:NADP-dependent oxidoreductase domain-containing protein [Trametes elegans]
MAIYQCGVAQVNYQLPSSRYSILDVHTSTGPGNHPRLWPSPPPPPTKLGRRLRFSPSAGIYVSPLQLGAMSTGDKWQHHVQFQSPRHVHEAGGNCIDTANNYQDYQNETSEEFIGEWMELRGNCDRTVIATKELRTMYINILYVHWPTCGIEEVMNNLHHVVVSGEVFHLGIPDAPAWVVSSSNRYARDYGETPFTIYKSQWNVPLRDLEREVIPMYPHESIALAPWEVLAGGKIRTDAGEGAGRQNSEKGARLRPADCRLRHADCPLACPPPAAVALAYVTRKTPYVFFALGGYKPEHLRATIEALDVVLSDEDIRTIESVVRFKRGPSWPTGMTAACGQGIKNNVSGLSTSAGHFDRWPTATTTHPASQ